MGIPGIILANNPFVVIGSMLAFTLFSLLLLGINYLSMHVSEANLSQGLLMVIYFVAVILAMAPGVAGAMFVGFSVGGLWERCWDC